MPDDHIREPPTPRPDSAFFEPCQPGTARSAPNGTRHAPCVRRDTLSRRRAGGLPRPMTDQHAMLGAETSGADGHDRPKVMVVEDDPDFRRLERVLQTVLEKRHLQHRTRILEQRLQGCVTFEGMVARSQQMLSVFAFIERLARYPTTALVTGESGTGKELVARALHELSPLRDRQLVICNCTTLAPTLLESELFGHTRGAFTGADRDRKGLFEAAHGGTIFLDEIGELPVGVQVKLLRVLENREIKRIGSPDPIRIDLRVV